MERINRFTEIFAIQFVPIVLSSIMGIYGNGELKRTLHFYQESWLLFSFTLMSILKRVYPKANTVMIVVLLFGFQAFDIFAAHNPAAVH